MIDILVQTFTSTFLSMLKILFIVLVAGILICKKVLSRANLHGLSVATVDVFLPCLSFTSISPVSYLACLVMMPLRVSVWNLVSHH